RHTRFSRDWSSTCALPISLLAAFSAALVVATARLRGADAPARIHIDAMGVVLAVSAMLLIGVGADRLAYWGVWRARPAAPLDLFDLSPTPLAIASGILLLHAFVVWTRRCRASGRTPLCAPELLRGGRERTALLSMFAIGALGAGVTFLLPLYIEVVQGRTSLYTAVALAPFTLASFVTAVVVVRFDSLLGPRRIARAAVLGVACGRSLLGAAVRNALRDAMGM